MNKTDLVAMTGSPTLPERNEEHLRCPACSGPERYTFPVDLYEAAIATHASTHSAKEWEDRINSAEQELEYTQARHRDIEAWYEKRVAWVREWRDAATEEKS